MNRKIMLILSMVILLGGLVPPSVGTVDPVNGLATGDTFLFLGDGYESEHQFRYSEMSNATDATLMHYDEEGMDREVWSNSETDISIVKQRDILPPLDTLLVMDTRGQTEVPSYEDWYRNELRMNESGMLQWNNFTDHRDLAFMNYGDNDEGQDGPPMMGSNSSYALIFPEMQFDNISIPMPEFWFNTTFDWNIPLDWREVSQSTGDFDINGNVHTLDYVNVTSEFFASHQENATDYIRFSDSGDPNDPNAPGIPVNISVSIEIMLGYEHIFDATNKMVLAVGDYSSFNIAIDITADDVWINFRPEDPNSQEVQIDFDSSMEVYNERANYAQIDQASAFYGNTRPTSSGTNALEAGDLLVYEFDENGYQRMEVMSNVDGMEESEMRSGDHFTYGDLMIDVFRHSDGSFESIVFLDGMSEGNYHEEKHWVDENGDPQSYFYDENRGPEEAHFLDFLSTPSLGSAEIAAFFDDTMWFEDPFRCKGDCGGDGEYYPEFPHEAPKVGNSVNITDWQVNLPEMGEDPVVINGNSFYYFNVTTHQFDYFREESMIIQVPIGDHNDIWIDATLDLYYDGSSAWHYDSETGALIVHEEYFYGEVNVYADTTVDFNDGRGPVSVTLDAHLIHERDMSMFLKSHPKLYDTGQTITSDTSSSSSTSSSTSSTTSETTGNDTTNTTPEGIDLPVSVGAVVGSLSFMVAVTVIRRRS